MNAETQKGGIETTKWIIVTILLTTAAVSGYFYHDIMLPLCLVTVAILISFSTYISFLIERGKLAIIFVREARVEMRKIIWPTYQQTLYTTLIIAAVSFVMSLALWGLDSILFRLVSFVINLRF